MRPLSVFASRALPHLIGCPEPLLYQAVLDTAIDFCERTLAVQVVSGPDGTQVGVGTYAIDIPNEQRVAAIVKVWFKDTPLTPVPADMLDSVGAQLSGVNGGDYPQGLPRWYFETAPGEIGVYPLPDAQESAALSARIATKPTRSATSVEDILYDDWCDAIVAGALSRVQSVPAQPFYSEAAAKANQTIYFSGVSAARDIAHRGRARSSTAVRFRSFV